MTLFLRDGSAISNVMATALVVPSQMPGTVLREMEKSASAKRSPFTSPRRSDSRHSELVSLEIFLSGPPKPGNALLPWRVLFADIIAENENAVFAAQRFLYHVGPQLSQKLDAPVYGIDIFTDGLWRFTQWDAGIIVKRGGTMTGSATHSPDNRWLSFLSRGSRGHLPPSLRAWAQENKLSLADVPVGKNWKRGANVVDYDSVAGLERKGLLMETNRVLYRVTVDVPTGEADGGIIQEP